jgi:hypothetical protein
MVLMGPSLYMKPKGPRDNQNKKKSYINVRLVIPTDKISRTEFL